MVGRGAASSHQRVEARNGETASRGGARLDAGGTIHIAYQDAQGDRLMYTTWNGAPGSPEVVDDGVRPGDRPHRVGAAAAIALVDGAPAIAYQDGLDADVYVATRAGAAWSTLAVATGPALDGFSIGAAVRGGAPVLAWGALDPAPASIDPARAPLGRLVVQAP